MPAVFEFDTGSVLPPSNPKSNIRATVCFPRPLVARPRLPHGLRMLDVDKNANIRIKSTLPHFTNTWADCHIQAWTDSTFYRAVDQVLVLAPSDLDFLTGERMRKSGDPAAVRVNFERPFVTPPRVVVFFNYLDLDKNRNWRLHVSASAIDANGFTFHMDTWGDTVLFGVNVCWIAYPEDRQHIFSTSVNTMDPGSVTQPRAERSRDVTFGSVEFWRKPSVFVALNFLDVDCKANLRINAHVSVSYRLLE